MMVYILWYSDEKTGMEYLIDVYTDGKLVDKAMLEFNNQYAPNRVAHVTIHKSK